MDRQTNDPQHERAWRSCPPGEITRLGQRIRSRHRRRVFLQVASVAAGTLAVTGGALWMWFGSRPPASKQHQENNFGGITCSEVQRLRSAYKEKRLGQKIVARIDVHLEHCSHCSQVYLNCNTGGRSSG